MKTIWGNVRQMNRLRGRVLGAVAGVEAATRQGDDLDRLFARAHLRVAARNYAEFIADFLTQPQTGCDAPREI